VNTPPPDPSAKLSLGERLVPRSTGPRGQPPPTPATGAAIADSGFRALVAEAWRRYQAALQAQRDIDWARYGEEFRRLGELLEQLGTGGADRQR
jgi:uncharacterized membrane protein (UPF0182 family)